MFFPLLPDLRGLWLNLPVFCAGAAMVLILRAKRGKRLWGPLDCNSTFRGKRIFGDHKRVLGPVVMAGVTSLIGVLLWYVVPAMREITILSEQEMIPKPLEVASAFALVGLGYSLGELPNSFLKRQMGLAPGELPSSRFRVLHRVLDLSDGVLGSAGMYAWVLSVSWQVLWPAVVSGIFLHRLIELALGDLTKRAKKELP